jgi:hypothetical protein
MTRGILPGEVSMERTLEEKFSPEGGLCRGLEVLNKIFGDGTAEFYHGGHGDHGRKAGRPRRQRFWRRLAGWGVSSGSVARPWTSSNEGSNREGATAEDDQPADPLRHPCRLGQSAMRFAAAPRSMRDVIGARL